MDMFPKELKDAKKKINKKAGGGKIELAKNIAKKGVEKGKEYLKKRKQKKNIKKIKQELKNPIKSKTKKGPVTTWNPDADHVKRAKKIREEKQKTVSDKINKYAGGGKIDKRALKETIKDIPRVAKEQAKKVGSYLRKGSSVAGPPPRNRKRTPKVIKAKGGGVVKKYASGGPVKKSIDGIAQRGLTRAKHK